MCQCLTLTRPPIVNRHTPLARSVKLLQIGRFWGWTTLSHSFSFLEAISKMLQQDTDASEAHEANLACAFAVKSRPYAKISPLISATGIRWLGSGEGTIKQSRNA